METRRLRKVLRANAGTSVVGGGIAAAAPAWTSEVLGIDYTGLTFFGGVGLVVFAAAVAVISSRPDRQLLDLTRFVSAADAAWVVASVAVVASGWLTPTGVIVTAALALAVADFGIIQTWLRRQALTSAADETSLGAPVPLASAHQ